MPETTVVGPDVVARKLGIDFDTLTDFEKAIVTDEVLAAQGKVRDFLNRPLTPTNVQVKELPYDDTYPLSDVQAWPAGLNLPDTRYKVAAYQVIPDNPGYYDVTFAVGLDVAQDDDLTSIRTYIRDDATAHVEQHPAFVGKVVRRISSVSAEGQSIRYTNDPTDPDAAGGAQSLATLRRWRRLGVGHGSDPDPRPWPYRA